MAPRKLPRDFYAQDTLEVARALLGKLLVLRSAGLAGRTPPAMDGVTHGTTMVEGRRIGRVVETEAYVGPEDLASHAARGRRPQSGRAAIMFGAPGHAYVYSIYGLHHCLNVVTEREGYPAAVLIRAVEPMEGLSLATNGPARLCRAFGIDRRHDGLEVTGDLLFFLDDGYAADPALVCTGPRVGVAYAGEWAARPWRFWIEGNRWVSH